MINVFGLFFLQEALKELEELKQIVPKESLVYFLIGKVRKLTDIIAILDFEQISVLAS